MPPPDPSQEDAEIGIEEAMDMPDLVGRCAFLGGYVDSGETVCWLGEEYICQAPRLVKTGKAC